ncbi:MAG: NAD(P)-dependent oxidoreductase [Candidatus Solibacter sp.]
MTRVLITGGTGFVGGQLVKRLRAEGIETTLLQRPATDLRDRDAVFETVRRARPDIVFHCAISRGHPANAAQRLESLESSVMGTAYLAEAAAEAGVQRFVHIGSSLVYAPQEREFRESDPLRPPTSRGAAKACAALWLEQFARSTKFPAVELRLFSVYGPGEGERRFIPTLLRAALSGEPMPLLAAPPRDFIYIDDVIDACLAAARTSVAPGAVFNIGTGVCHTNQQVVAIARQVTGRPIPLADAPYPGSPSDRTHWLADISAARRDLGWSPRRSLPEGLAATWEYLRRTQ